MARKPNYQFERMERQRAKDSKKAARLEAKRRKAEEGNVENDGIESPGGESDGASAAPPDGPREDDAPDR